MDNEIYRFSTQSIHAGYDPVTGARITPIYQTASYVFKDTEHAANLFALKELGYIYSRLTNPTIGALENKLAALEGGVGATGTSSGHAAQLLTFFTLLELGDEFVAANKLYGGSINQFSNSFPRSFGWKCRFVNPDSIDAFKKAITPKTKAIFVESLANPGGVIADLEAIAKVSEEAGVPLIVDNTMATSYLCRPFEYGANLVVYSTTKFMSGHGNSLGGAVIDSGTFYWSASSKYPALSEPEPGYHGLKFHETFGELAFTFYAHAVGLRDLGPNQQPINAWLTSLGMETLPLRMQKHSDNALEVARYLEKHDAVEWVNYAGLETSPYHKLQKKYMPKGAGAVFTFGVKGGLEVGKKIVESVKLFSHLANIGDTRSLIIHPASTTHSQLDEDALIAAGSGSEVLRLSIGIEDTQDLIQDLEQALSSVQ